MEYGSPDRPDFGLEDGLISNDAAKQHGAATFQTQAYSNYKGNEEGRQSTIIYEGHDSTPRNDSTPLHSTEYTTLRSQHKRNHDDVDVDYEPDLPPQKRTRLDNAIIRKLDEQNDEMRLVFRRFEQERLDEQQQWKLKQEAMEETIHDMNERLLHKSNNNKQAPYINKKIPEFAGKTTEDFESWECQSRAFLEQFDCSEAKNLSLLKMGISGEALKILRTITTPFTTVDDLYNKLRKTYGEPENKIEQLESIRQEADEPVRRFIGRLTAGLVLTGMLEDSAGWDATLLHHFKDKVRVDIKAQLLALHPIRMSYATEQAVSIETSLRSTAAEKLLSIHQGESQQPHRKRPLNIECYHCHKKGHSFRHCFTAKKHDKDLIEETLAKQPKQNTPGPTLNSQQGTAIDSNSSLSK